MKKEDTKAFDLELQVKSAVPIYEQIKNAVKLAIFTTKLVEGDKVISIRDLSTSHNINPITIMKAYSQLENEGFLFSRRGTGYFVQIDHEKLQQGRKEMFKKEISRFLMKIASLGYTVEEFLEELKTYMKKKGESND